MEGRDRILLFREKEAKSFCGGCRGLGKLGGSVAGLVGLLLTFTAMADPAAVLVTTVPAQQGALPDILTAYGDAEPAQGSGTVISLPQDGRVAALLVTQGERVSAGTRLLVFNQAASVASAYAQALTALNLAQTERAHTAQLLAQRLATRDQLAQADKAAADAGAALDALRRQGADRARTEITAPFDAVVASIPVSPGDRLASGRRTHDPGAAGRPRGDRWHRSVAARQGASRHAGRLSRLAEDPGVKPPFEGAVLRLDGLVNPGPGCWMLTSPAQIRRGLGRGVPRRHHARPAAGLDRAARRGAERRARLLPVSDGGWARGARGCACFSHAWRQRCRERRTGWRAAFDPDRRHAAAKR